MTDNKRFTMDYEETYRDVMYLDNGKVMTDKEVLDKLNTFNDENEQLKKENEHLKIRFKEERDTAMKLGSECDNLTIKNQKLELEIIRLETIIKSGEKYD